MAAGRPREDPWPAAQVAAAVVEPAGRVSLTMVEPPAPVAAATRRVAVETPVSVRRAAAGSGPAVLVLAPLLPVTGGVGGRQPQEARIWAAAAAAGWTGGGGGGPNDKQAWGDQFSAAGGGGGSSWASGRPHRLTFPTIGTTTPSSTCGPKSTAASTGTSTGEPVTAPARPLADRATTLAPPEPATPAVPGTSHSPTRRRPRYADADLGFTDGQLHERRSLPRSLRLQAPRRGYAESGLPAAVRFNTTTGAITAGVDTPALIRSRSLPTTLTMAVPRR